MFTGNSFRRSFGSIIVGFVLAGCGQSVDAQPEYTRSECIQKVVLDWDGYSSSEIEETIKNIAAAMHTLEDDDLPSFVFPLRARGEWYLQYPDDCEFKQEITERIILDTVAPKVTSFPDYQISNEVVIPSPRTISITGKYWLEDDYD